MKTIFFYDLTPDNKLTIIFSFNTVHLGRSMKLTYYLYIHNMHLNRISNIFKYSQYVHVTSVAREKLVSLGMTGDQPIYAHRCVQHLLSERLRLSA